MNEKITAQLLYKASFSPTAETYAISKALQEALGLDTLNKLARLAIGRSLGVSQDTVIDNDEKPASQAIKGHILFNESDFFLWVALIVTDISSSIKHGEVITIERFQRHVRYHWSNGLKLLNEDWEASDHNYRKFWNILSKRYATTSDKPIVIQKPDQHGTFSTSDDYQVKFKLGKIINSNESFEYVLNGSGYSPHLAIMGQSGSGKTRILLNILEQVVSQFDTPVLLLDLGKGELLENKSLLNHLGATPLDIPNQPIPLDMFYDAREDPENAALEFRDSLKEVVGSTLGPKQGTNLYEAIIDLFKTEKHISLNAIYETLELYYQDNSLSHDSVTATLHDLTIHNLFTPSFSPQEFFSKSWVISFANARDTDKTFTLCLLLSALNFFLKKCQESELSKNGCRKLKIILAIDEARTVLNLKHNALSENIRLHRSKGLSVMLSSQSPDDYDGKSDDYLENIGLPICFTTNATSSKVLRNMFGESVNFSSLNQGVCLTINNKKPIKVQAF